MTPYYEQKDEMGSLDDLHRLFIAVVIVAIYQEILLLLYSRK